MKHQRKLFNARVLKQECLKSIRELPALSEECGG